MSCLSTLRQISVLEDVSDTGEPTWWELATTLPTSTAWLICSTTWLVRRSQRAAWSGSRSIAGAGSPKCGWTSECLASHIPFSERNFDAGQYRYTKSWYNADEQRSFLINSGGSSVPLSQARPGDVIYFNWSDSAAHGGEVSHHAAIVSSVLPNGEVLYTQHTPGATNYSLEDRLPIRLQDQDPQTVVVIRPPGAQ
ncbi:MAG: amidase domain-containing protein [Mycobacterium sp.]|nr:amidase domain-containing protein [Mycobacterium sp.]